MEILTKLSPIFRLVLFLLALPVFGLAQQFPVNNQKIVQGVGTTAQGISSYSSSPPTTAPTAATFRHVTSIHMDTVLQIQYIYKRPRWYPISVVRRATPPPATASSGSTTIDYTESIWQSTADSLTYYYEEENACWQPVGTVVRDTTPVSLAATGTSAAVCYEYSLWYNSTNDSLYAYTAGAWLAVGSGGVPDPVDSIAVLQDSIVVGYSLGVEVTRDTIGYPVPDIGDIPGLADSLAAAPSGTGTNQRIVVWTGTNSQGNSTQLQSAAGVTLDANLAYRITGGTTASRPTGAAGMMYWNTSNGWFDYHNGTAWLNPLIGSFAGGAGVADRIFFGQTTTGYATQSAELTFRQSLGYLGVGSVTAAAPIHVKKDYASSYGQLCLQSATGVGNQAIVYESYFDAAGTRLITFGLGHYASSTDPNYYFANEISGGGVVFRTTAVNRLTITSTGAVGIGTTSPDRLLHSELSDAITSSIVFPLRLTHITSGTAAAGSGAGMEFEAESAGGTNQVAGTIENPFTTATNAAEVSDLVFRTMRAGTLTESLRSLGNGTLQIGTLSGTATQMVGATAANILCPITLGAGLSFSSGTLNGAFLPLTLTGATEVNTAGQNLYFRDAAGYPFTFMNSNYFLAASGVNNYIDVGSTASNVKIISDGLIELNSSVNTSLITTGRLLIDGDSTVIDATLPVNTNATHVLVRDVSTQRLEEKAISTIGSGVYLPLTLTGNTTVNTAGNQLTISDADTYPYLILTSTAFETGSAAGTLIGASGADISIRAGAAGGDIELEAVVAVSTTAPYLSVTNDDTETGGVVRLLEGSDNGTNYAIIKAPDNLSTNPVFTTPATNGNAKGVLETDGSGVTAWTNAPQVYNLVGNSAAPGLAIANAGTGATITGYSAESSSVSGRFTITTGTGAMAGGSVVQVTFTSVTFPQLPIVQIQGDATKNTAGGLAAAVLIGSGKCVPIAATTNFILHIDATGLANSTRYDFTYTVSSAN